MPSWELFEVQSREYRDSVSPRSVHARLAVEAGVPARKSPVANEIGQYNSFWLWRQVHGASVGDSAFRWQIKRLESIAVQEIRSGYALDYCNHLVDIVASGFLVPCWRRPNSPCFGDRCDCRNNKARHRPRCLGLSLQSFPATSVKSLSAAKISENPQKSRSSPGRK